MIGFAVTTKMNVLHLIGQMIMAMQTGVVNTVTNFSDDMENTDMLEEDERHRRGAAGMVSGLSIADLLSGAQKVAEAVQKFQNLNEE